MKLSKHYLTGINDNYRLVLDVCDLVKKDFSTKNVTPKTFLHGSTSKFTEGFTSVEQLETYFKTHDVDICTPVNPVLQNMLLFKGWKKIVDTNYYDNPVLEKTFLGLNVQISFREDFEEYCVFWRHLEPKFYVEFLWKHSPRYLGKDTTRRFIKQSVKMVRAGSSLKAASPYFLENLNFNPMEAVVGDWQDGGFAPGGPLPLQEPNFNVANGVAQL